MQTVSEQRFVYDGWNLIARFDVQPSSLSLHTSYLWGQDLSGSMQGAGGVGGLLSVTENSSGDVFYPTYDANGNISEYLDDAGAVEAHYEYSPFGRIIASTGSPDDFAFRFSTKYQDNETDLLYYGFRYYDAETGRWLNRDPIQEEGGLNLYGFVGNSILNKIDYLGMALLIADLMQDVRSGVNHFDFDREAVEAIIANLGSPISPGQYQYNGPISSLLTDSARDFSKALFESIEKEIDYRYYFNNYPWETGSAAAVAFTTVSVLVFTGNVNVNESVRVNVLTKTINKAGPCELEIFLDVIPFVHIRGGEFERVNIDYEFGVRTNFRF